MQVPAPHEHRICEKIVVLDDDPTGVQTVHDIHVYTGWDHDSIRPGIQVWQTGAESKFPQTPYVIFPGNVGENTTLREAVEVLTAK